MSYSKKMMNPLVQNAVNLTLFVCIFSVTVIMADVVLKYILKIPSDQLKQIVRFDDSKKPSKRLKPNLNVTLVGAYQEFQYEIQTRADGFRKTAPFELNDAVEPEVVVIGDSQAFGIGVDDDETFSSIIGIQSDRPVLNVSCPGYSTVEQYHLAEEILDTVRPKEMILAFFSGNDPYENYKHQALLDAAVIKKQSQIKGSDPELSLLSQLKNALVKNSSIYNLMIRLRKYPAINKGFRKMGWVNQEVPSELAVFQIADSDKKNQYWKVTETAIRKILELARRKNVHLTVLFVPDRYQVDDPYWDMWISKYSLSPDQYDRLAPNRTMQEIARKLDLALIDPTSNLREAQVRGEKPYWSIDNHLSPKGHETIGRVMAEKLMMEKI